MYYPWALTSHIPPNTRTTSITQLPYGARRYHSGCNIKNAMHDQSDHRVVLSADDNSQLPVVRLARADCAMPASTHATATPTHQTSTSHLLLLSHHGRCCSHAAAPQPHARAAQQAAAEQLPPRGGPAAANTADVAAGGAEQRHRAAFLAECGGGGKPQVPELMGCCC